MALRKNVDTLLKKFEKQYTTHNTIEVSQSAILHNIDVFETLSSKQVIPVLKGNAYGHGTTLVAKALRKRKLPYVAVDGYFEALRIREVSKQPVLVMGAILPENFARMKYDNFAFVIQDEATIHALGKTKKSIKVHLECNTGMNRYGVKPDEVIRLTKLILSYKNLDLEGIMSHLADSDGNDPVTVNSAVAIFDTCVDAVRAIGANPNIIHVAQSAGSLKAHSKYANTIRVGVGTYGINPFPKNHPLNRQLQKELRPALKLVSTVTKIIELEKGDEVSYNYTFTAPKKMKIAVIPLGYYDGVNRALSNSGVVKIGETFAPIIGRICMNHTMLSLEYADTKVGDRVVIYSNNPANLNAIDMVASRHNLFNYNLLTALSPDVRRTLVA